jgi:hypothetical protein
MNINCSVPLSILSIIAKKYLEDARRAGKPQRNQKPQ